MYGLDISLVVGDLTENSFSSREVDKSQAHDRRKSSGLADSADDLLVPTDSRGSCFGPSSPGSTSGGPAHAGVGTRRGTLIRRARRIRRSERSIRRGWTTVVRHDG